MLNQPRSLYNPEFFNRLGIEFYARQMHGWKMTQRIIGKDFVFGVFLPEKGDKKSNNGKKEK